jgi:hypothetical protein
MLADKRKCLNVDEEKLYANSLFNSIRLPFSISMIVLTTMVILGLTNLLFDQLKNLFTN